VLKSWDLSETAAWKMSGVRVTIALNAKQSQKAVLLLPTSSSARPDAIDSYKAFVFKAAQAKLRLKKPTRAYVGQTGHELISEEDRKSNITDDVVLLVSAGEDYVGAKRAPQTHAGVNPECPIQVLASKAPADQLSITQLTTTAHTLSGIVHAVGQPDLHPGTKFLIGAVFASRKWIHPTFHRDRHWMWYGMV